MRHYSMGIVLCGDSQLVVEKNQKNVKGYNGLGGELMPSESYRECMRREFLEEAIVESDHWSRVGLISIRNDCKIALFLWQASEKFHVPEVNDSNEVQGWLDLSSERKYAPFYKESVDLIRAGVTEIGLRVDLWG